jgi:hypothetical protein
MPATISINFTTKEEVEGSNPPINKSVSASVLRSVLNAGQIGSGYVTLAGSQTITGAKTFSEGITATTATVNTSVQVGVGSNGYVRLNNGSATKPGYLAWFTPGDVRRGYLGWESGDTDNITFNLENGWGLVMNSPSKPVVIQGELSVSTSLSARESVFNRSVKVGVGPNGYVQLEDGTTTKPGYLSWFTPDNVRRGYVGWESTPVPYDDENIQFKLENGWGLVMNSPSKPVVIMGDLEVTGSCDADNACKAWGCFSRRPEGLFLKSYNIESIETLNTGIFIINFASNMPNRKYAVIATNATAGDGTGTTVVNDNAGSNDIPSTVTSNFGTNTNSGKNVDRVKMRSTSGGTGIACSEIYVAVFASPD